MLDTNPTIPRMAYRRRPTVTRAFRVGGSDRPTSIWDQRRAEWLERMDARLDAEKRERQEQQAAQ